MDELLAVGDVNFQNKCINRMRKVAEEEGKTILYVSHNMATVKSLCDRCVVLSHGQKAFDGSVEDAIAIYMKEDMPNQLLFYATDEQRDYKCNLRHKIICSELIDLDSNIIDYGNKFMFRLRWNSENNKERVLFKCVLYKADRTAVGVVFGGELIKKAGDNYVDFLFDTKYLISTEQTQISNCGQRATISPPSASQSFSG